MTEEKRQMLEVYLQEYSKLKDEQAQRIGFRDNLLYVILGVFGGILAFAVGEKANPYALLVLPWVSLILGWTYLVNDDKITQIGKYIREYLVKKVSELTDKSDPNFEEIEYIFGWEFAHKSDKRRKRRKLEQLVIDEVTFVASGIAALLVFWYLAPEIYWGIQIFCLAELSLLLILGWEIFVYADLAKGRYSASLSGEVHSQKLEI